MCLAGEGGVRPTDTLVRAVFSTSGYRSFPAVWHIFNRRADYRGNGYRFLFARCCQLHDFVVRVCTTVRRFVFGKAFGRYICICVFLTLCVLRLPRRITPRHESRSENRPRRNTARPLQANVQHSSSTFGAHSSIRPVSSSPDAQPSDVHLVSL